MPTPTALITFNPDEELTAAIMNQLETLFVTNVSATPLVLVGAGIQLTVSGIASLATTQISSLTVSGSSNVPTLALNDNSFNIANTAYVQTQIASQLSSSGTFVGSNVNITGGTIDGTNIGLTTPASGVFGTLITQTPLRGNNTNSVATTAFVNGQASTVLPLPDGTAATGTSLFFTRQDHVHPTATSLSLTSGTVNGVTIGLTNPAGAAFTSIANSGAQFNNVRVVTTPGTVTQLSTDYLIVINKTVGQATQVVLITNPLLGATVIIKDGRGDAATNAITVLPATGTIDGQSGIIINVAYGSVGLMYNGLGWSIVEEILPSSGGTVITNNLGTGSAFGSTADGAIGVSMAAATGSAFGGSSATGRNGSLSTPSSPGTATGSSVDNAVGASLAFAVGAATGNGVAIGIDSQANTGAGAATGSSTDAAVGTSTVRAVGSATGTSTDGAQSATSFSAVGSATGTGVATGAAPSQPESASGTTVTLPSQTLFASRTPGTNGTAPFNSFSLTANPGVVVFNMANDTTTSAVVELYYLNHTVYYQNTSGNWLSWASANNWVTATSPFPPSIVESTEGTLVSTVNGRIYASTNVGTVAPITATIGNGLQVFALTANPGLVQLQTTATGGFVVDTNTANVTQLAYHNHQMFQFGNGAWYPWVSPGVYTTPGLLTSPLPTSQAIFIAPQLSEATNATFIVSGTLEGYTGGGLTTIVNLIRNTTPSLGSASGTPGILPTNWSGALDGTTQTVVGTGLSDPSTNLPYIDINFTGTPIVGDPAILFDNTTSIGVLPSSPYTMSAYVSLSGGSATNFIGFNIQTNEFTSTGAYNNTGSDVFLNVTATPTLMSVTKTTAVGTTSIVPFFAAQMNPGTPVNATVRFSGIQFQTGSSVTTFQQTPVASGGLPTLNYQDNQTGSWLPFSSTVNVMANTFSFVHPPVTTTTAAFTVGVRDANATAISALSNAFSVSPPGVVTLSSISYTPANTAPSSGQPAGTLVGTFVVNVAGGTFTGGTVRTGGTNAALFSISGPVSNVYTVSTASVISASPPSTPYAFTVIATLTGAVNSPLTSVPISVTVSAESAPGTSVPSATFINASTNPGSVGSGNIITITSGAQVAVNGVTITNTNNVTELYYVGHTAFQLGSGAWWGPIVAGSGGVSQASPVVAVTLSSSNFLPTSTQTASELVAAITVNAGGTDTITLSLTGTYAADFTFTQGSTSVTSVNYVAGSTNLYTRTGFAMSAGGGSGTGGTYPIIITANVT
jgi:hypothetical protein